MQTVDNGTYVNGFVIGKDGRVVVDDAEPKGFWQGIPTTADLTAAGKEGSQIKFSNNRVSMDAEGKMVYLDHGSKPYTGTVFGNGGMAYTDRGELLCDSKADVKFFNGGLPLTSLGYLAIKSSRVPAPPGKAFIYSADATGLDVEYKFSIESALPQVDKWEARYVNTTAGIDKTVDITSSIVNITGGYLMRVELTPPGTWQIYVRASNALGAGTWSDPFTVKTTSDPTMPIQLKFTPAVDMVVVELTEAVLAGKTIDYYTASILDKTYDFRLSDRLVTWEQAGPDVVRIRIPGKVGSTDAWFTMDTGWEVSYVAIASDGADSKRSPDYLNPTITLAPTTATPLKANVTSATGDLNTFTVNFEPGAGETSQIDGWFIGVGSATGDDTDYVWTFVANGTARTFTGKAFKADDEYGVCVRPYSTTGGMSDEGSFASITP